MTAGTSHVFHRDLHHRPLRIASGRGVWLRGEDGTSYLDAAGGAAVVTIGHGVPEVYASLAEAAESTVYVYGGGFTSPWTERFADELIDLTPWPADAVYLVSGGSEANETAIKMARQYHLERGKPHKHKVIARWQSYHGVTLGMLSVSGRTSWRQPYDPYLFDVPRISAPYCYRCPLGRSYPSCRLACADELDRLIRMEGADTVAAFIAEPVIGTTVTAVTPPPDYHQRIREICDRHDILFIADEVLSGYGRTGSAFAISHSGVTPDIATLGKGIGSGYAALGAVIAAPHVVAAFRAGSGRFNHGFTYSGLPAGARIGLAVLDYCRRHDLFARSAELGGYLQELLRELAARQPLIGDVRGRGLYAGVEFVADRRSREPLPATAGFAATVARLVEREHQVLIRPGLPGANHGQGGDHIQISPPFVITRAELDRVVTALDQAISTAARALPGPAAALPGGR